LHLGGLPDVDHRFAFEHRGRQQLALAIVTLPGGAAGGLEQQAGQPGERDSAPRWGSFRAALPNRMGY
jgi:hypothetical protein